MNVSFPTASDMPFAIPSSRWDRCHAKQLSLEELFRYRSTLFEADDAVCNPNGGSASAKLMEIDPLTGDPVKILWMTETSPRIGSIRSAGSAALYLDRLLGLEQLYSAPEDDDKLIGRLSLCSFHLSRKPASLDVPLHALLPFEHVDHICADAIAALAISSGGEAAVREIWGDKVGWLPWQRPGFALAVHLRDFVAANPGFEAVILAGQGMICWAETARSCYERTIGLVADAALHLNAKLAKRPAFGGWIVAPAGDRRAVAARLMPRLRGMMSGAERKVGDFSDDFDTLQFVGAADFERLASTGTYMRHHLLGAKSRPLILDPAKLDDDDYLNEKLAAYRVIYAAHCLRFSSPDSPSLRDLNPVVVAVPGVGRFTFAADKATASFGSDLFRHMIAGICGAEAVGEAIGVEEPDAFDVGCGAGEAAEPSQKAKPKPLSGRIAMVTGGAGRVGGAIAARLLRDGACVMLVDDDADGLSITLSHLETEFDSHAIRAAVCNLADEKQVRDAIASCACEFGGLDILVVNPSRLASAPTARFTSDVWHHGFNDLADGSYLASHAAWPLLKRMKVHGGTSIVFIGSAAAVDAAAGMSAWTSARSAENHLTRRLAIEGARDGIRVNIVHPGAVIRVDATGDGCPPRGGLHIHRIGKGSELEEQYRERSLLKRDVVAEDIAEAVCFFAGDFSGKSTGNILNVDAGNPKGFTP